MENNVDQPDLAYSSPSQPASVPSPQKGASIFWKVLVGVLVLVVGALAFVTYSLYQTIQILTQLPSPTPVASIEPSLNPTMSSLPSLVQLFPVLHLSVAVLLRDSLFLIVSFSQKTLSLEK